MKRDKIPVSKPDSSDPNSILANQKKCAEVLIRKYNNLYPSEKEQRKCIIKELLGSVGNDFMIEQPFTCTYGQNVHIGENFYANVECLFLDEANIEIGNNVLMGPHVGIYTVKKTLGGEAPTPPHPVKIGNDVWIGGNVTILPGVTIGNNALIIAGSIVTRNIPENAIAAGNPAKVIKYIDVTIEID